MDSKAVQPQDKYVLRLPDGMRDQIKAAAEKSGRSMNAEIIHRLANSLNFQTLADAGYDLDEDLNFQLISLANSNNRSLKEEIEYRLKISVQPYAEIENRIYDLEHRNWSLQNKCDEATDLLMQMTPEERRILEERKEVSENRFKHLVDSRFIGELIQMKPIGKRGRKVFTVKPPGQHPAFKTDRS